MAIITINQIVAGMQPAEDYLKITSTPEAPGVHCSTFYRPGRPGAASVPTGLNGTALTSYDGQIPFRNPVSGNSYLAKFTCSSDFLGIILLCDRLWHNGSIDSTVTTEQAITHPGLPARCPPAVGSTPDGSGNNIMCAIEFSSAGIAGAITNTTLNYTNTAGNSDKTGTISLPSGPTANTFVPFQLQEGDTGIQSIQGITLGTSYGSTTIHLVQYRVLARLQIQERGVGNRLDPISGGFPRLYDNTVPFLVWIPTSISAVTMMGKIVVAQG